MVPTVQQNHGAVVAGEVLAAARKKLALLLLCARELLLPVREASERQHIRGSECSRRHPFSAC